MGRVGTPVVSEEGVYEEGRSCRSVERPHNSMQQQGKAGHARSLFIIYLDVDAEEDIELARLLALRQRAELIGVVLVPMARDVQGVPAWIWDWWGEGGIQAHVGIGGKRAAQ